MSSDCIYIYTCHTLIHHDVKYNTILNIFVVCEMNVHKRCQLNVGNNCGVKTKEIAEMLARIGQNAHDIKNKQKKVSVQFKWSPELWQVP